MVGKIFIAIHAQIALLRHCQSRTKDQYLADSGKGGKDATPPLFVTQKLEAF